MRERGELEHMVLLDFRAATTSKPRPFTASDIDDWILRICFCDQYTKAVVYGLEDQPVTLDVGVSNRVINSTISGVDVPFRT